jgi:hypothetical protein
MQQGGEPVKKATAVFVMLVLSLAAACAPTAPTPTPTREPTPAPVEVLATKPEHLAGIWAVEAQLGGRGFRHYRFEADGTISYQRVYEDFQLFGGRFWFEDGVYYEESEDCFPIGSYRAYLEIEGGRAVRLRFEVIDDWDQSCTERRLWRTAPYRRVDW